MEEFLGNLTEATETAKQTAKAKIEAQRAQLNAEGNQIKSDFSAFAAKVNSNLSGQSAGNKRRRNNKTIKSKSRRRNSKSKSRKGTKGRKSRKTIKRVRFSLRHKYSKRK